MSAEHAILNKANQEAGNTVAVWEHDYDVTKHLDVTPGMSGNNFITEKDVAITTDIHDIFGDNSIIATFNLDGNAKDLGGNYNGTAVGLTWGRGKFNTGAVLTNPTTTAVVTDYIYFDPYTVIGDFTISFWLSKTAGSAVMGLNSSVFTTSIEVGSSMAVQIDDVYYPAKPDNYDSTDKTLMNHYVYIRSGGVLRTYLNGVSSPDASISTATFTLTLIGSYTKGSTSTSISGTIDQIRFFHKALNETEVLALFNENTSPKTAKYSKNFPSAKIHDIFNDGSCVATYTFDGNTNDLGGNYAGIRTVGTNSLYYKGRFYGSRGLNGTTDSNVNLGGQLITSNVFSVSFSAWFNNSARCNFTQWKTGVGGLFIMITGSNELTLYMDSDGDGNSNTNLAKTANLGTGYKHVVVTSDGVDINVYVDKVKLLTYPAAYLQTIPAVNSAVNAAHNSSGVYSQQPYDYHLDQLRVFNRSVTEDEINTLYLEELPQKTTVDIADVFGDGSIVAHYRLDGDATDNAGNYDGIASNITYSTGKFDLGAVFNGTSSVVSLGNVLNTVFSNDFSCSAWVNYKTTDDDQLIIFSKGAWSEATGTYVRLYLRNAVPYIQFGWQNQTTYNGLTSNSFDLRDAGWNHIVAIRKNNVNYVYLNGIFLESGSAAPVSITNTYNLYFGKRDPDNFYKKGLLDQVRFFNRALTQKEILELYNEKPQLKAVIKR